MKTVVITTPGGPEVLEIQVRPVPVPGRVRFVRVRNATLWQVGDRFVGWWRVVRMPNTSTWCSTWREATTARMTCRTGGAVPHSDMTEMFSDTRGRCDGDPSGDTDARPLPRP